MAYIVLAAISLLSGVLGSRRMQIKAFAALSPEDQNRAVAAFNSMQKKQLIPLGLLMAASVFVFFFWKPQGNLIFWIFIAVMVAYLIGATALLLSAFRSATLPGSFIRSFFLSRLAQAAGYAGFVLIFGYYYFTEITV